MHETHGARRQQPCEPRLLRRGEKTASDHAAGAAHQCHLRLCHHAAEAAGRRKAQRGMRDLRPAGAYVPAQADTGGQPRKTADKFLRK